MDEKKMEAARELRQIAYQEFYDGGGCDFPNNRASFLAGYDAGYAAANEWVRIVPKEVSKIQLRDGTHIYLDHGHGGWRIRSTRLGIDDEIVYTTLDDALDVVREKQSEMAELGYAEYAPYQPAPTPDDGNE